VQKFVYDAEVLRMELQAIDAEEHGHQRNGVHGEDHVRSSWDGDGCERKREGERCGRPENCSDVEVQDRDAQTGRGRRQRVG